MSDNQQNTNANGAVPAVDALLERARRYANYVNDERAFPSVLDGLKPVQRRIIYAMLQAGYVRSRATVKSARIVGDVIGRYHPHGDQAVYDALVRMAQPFTCNVPLIDGQGNFGSVDGDPPAAMRYTEARLSEEASLWRSDLHQDIVAFQPNFDESLKEASLLPVSFPIAFVNGSDGIGWSIAHRLPPHNPTETLNALLHLLRNPQATVKDLMRYIKGPDFPSGGVIVSPPEDIERIYQTGRGTIVLEGLAREEVVPGGGRAVVVYSLPYQVGSENLKQSILDAGPEKITECSGEIHNLSGRGGVRVVVKLKRGGSPDLLLEQLRKYTKFRVQIPVNLTFYDPEQMRWRFFTLRDLLRSFLQFRSKVLRARLEHEKRALIAELERLLAMLAALDVIDEVIKIVRTARDDTEAAKKLKRLLKVRVPGTKQFAPPNDRQVQAVLDTPLRRLVRLAKQQLARQTQEKEARLKEIGHILTHNEAFADYVAQDLQSTEQRLRRQRLTIIGAAADGRQTPTASDKTPPPQQALRQRRQLGLAHPCMCLKTAE